jgi:glyoxylase-like metal-dependent hydrolase (beta-lactamase superfamily II)
LIDCGPPHTALELASWLRKQEVRQVINTHHHEDHSGANSVLASVLGLPLAAPDAAVSLLAVFPRLELYRRVVWGQPENVVATCLGATVETRHFRFRVLATPGHSPDHVCFFEADQGWLFSGDLFIHERAHYLRRDEDLRSLIESLNRVLALRPELLVCSHAGLVPDAVGALERKLAYWQVLGEKAQSMRQSKRTLREINGSLLGREGMMTRISRGHISKINLIRALLDLDPGLALH